MNNLKKFTPGEIKYYFHYDYPLHGNASWCTPTKVKFLTETAFVEVNYDNSRTSVYQDDYDPKADRLGYVEYSGREHSFFFDTYKESLEAYANMRRRRAEAKLEEYTKKAEAAREELLDLEKELAQAQHSTYPTNIHGNPEHVPETTVVYDTTVEKADLIYDILKNASKHSVSRRKNPKIGDKYLVANFLFMKKDKSKELIAKILGITLTELNFHSFLILTTDNVPTITKTIKKNGYIPAQSFMGRLFS